MPYLTFNQVMKYISTSLAAVEYILEQKALPGHTTFVAYWKVLTSDRICLLLAFLLGSHVFNNSWILASLSDGNLIFMQLVSKKILKKDRDAKGLSSLSVAMGTPNSARKDTNVSTLQ